MMTALSWIIVLVGVAIVAISMIAKPRATGTAVLGGALVVAGWFVDVATSWWAVILVTVCLVWAAARVWKVQGYTRQHSDVERNQRRALTHGVAVLAVFVVAGLTGTFVQWNHDHPAAPTASIVTPWTNDDGTPVKATAAEIGRTGAVEAPKVAERVHYHAYDAPQGKNNFGQNRDPKTAEEAVGQLKLLAAEDPQEFSAIVEARANGVDAANDNGSTARQWLNDHSKWQAAIDEYFSADTSFVLVDAGDVPYYSLGAIRDASGDRNIMPKLTQLTELQKLGKVLIVLDKDGEAVQLLRVPCDYQPSMPKPFKNVPTQNGKQPSPPGPRPTTPETPSTPPTTPSTPGTSTPPTSTPPTSTPPTSTPPTSTTPPNECPPGTFPSGDECLNSKPSSEGPSLPVQPQPSHTEPPESTQPTEPNPATPGPTDDPAPNIPAPGATDVPETPRDTATLPPTASNAPDPGDRGDESGDPDTVQQQPAAPGATQDEPPAVVDGQDVNVDNMAFTTPLRDSGNAGQWTLIVAGIVAAAMAAGAFRRRH